MRYIRKQFLSDDYHESGSMVVKCENPKDVNAKKNELDAIIHEGNVYVDASIQMRDCYGKPIDLDFSFSDESGYAKRLDKVELMIDMLCEFKTQLRIHWADVKERGEKE
jgi:hypothetical protein